MKRILILIATLALALSCMEKSIYTQSGTVLATFEFSGINYSEMFGEDSLYFDTKYKVGIGWDLLAFYHQVDKETSEFEGGFMTSYLEMPSSGETDVLSNNEYRAYMKPVKAGLKNTYLVFNQTDSMPEHDMGFTFVESHGSTGTCVMKSCQVNNTVAVAKAVNEKSIEMIRQDELLPLTGYIHGGCSPIGMKKLFRTTFHSDITGLETVAVSAGKVGAQIEVEPDKLIKLVNGRTADLISSEQKN